jgi:Phage integrase family
VPLLQVAPSKIDAERVFPISPELAHVFAQIVERVRGEHATVPLCPRYDPLERTWGPPLPHLFQRPAGGAHQVFSPASVRNWLRRTLERADLRDVDGTPITFVPHDFRRLFATEVVNTGLPIHIAAAVLGHRALDTTRGYTAVYPEEVIRHYQTFIHERRANRPSADYRDPTDAEWAEFERHFTLRKVAYGNCDRPYGSRCAHEHACVRCPMLRPEPSRLPLLRELETNLTEPIAEARDRVWLGEVAGLQETLVACRVTPRAAELAELSECCMIKSTS